MFKRILLAVFAAIALVIAGTGTAMASTHPHNKPALLTHAQQVAASYRFAKQLANPNAGDTTLIYTQNGIHSCFHASPFGVGNPVIVKALASGPCDPLHEVFITADPEGFPEYRFSFNNPGTVWLASTIACDKVTQKIGDSNGVTMIVYTAPNDNQYLVPRYCTIDGDYGTQLGSDNILNHQWHVGSDMAWYRALILSIQ